MTETSPTFDVVMSVYGRDNPRYLTEALDSLRAQSRQPRHYVLVQDGPLGHDLQYVLDRWIAPEGTTKRVVPLSKNQGLGIALRTGVEACSSEFVARMDADDVCEPKRFERQLSYIATNSALDLIGGTIEEFRSEPGDLGLQRNVPLDQDSIYRRLGWRNAMNHVTVMFRLSAVREVGSYRDRLGFEDWDLWLRMRAAGHRMTNLTDTLVHARTDGLMDRRSGRRYAKLEQEFLRNARAEGLLSFGEYLTTAAARAVVRRVDSTTLATVYRRMLRSSSSAFRKDTKINE